MEIFYVDLGRTGTGHQGTTVDPFSWADVIASLVSIEKASFDSGKTYDVGNHYDSAQVNVVYRCRGTGEVLNQAGSVDLQGLRFTDTSGIEITAWDPWMYGLPVLRTPANTDLTSTKPWFRISSSTQVSLQFHGFVFGINLPLTGADTKIIDVDSPVFGSLKFYNNVVVDNGLGNQLVGARGATPDFKMACTGNTVVYGSLASGSSSVFRCENGTLYTGLNFAVQATSATNTVIFGTSTLVAYSNANAFGLKPSAITYTGVSPIAFSADVAGLTLSQGIWGPEQLVPSNLDPVWSSTSGIPLVQTNVFWPVHQGKLLALATTDALSSLDLGTGGTDAVGVDRKKGFGDAGAFQKTGVTLPQTVHVDLADNSVGSGIGSEDAPIGLQDFLTDYSRRAPVDYNLTYVLRNKNSGTLSGIDLGPLAPDVTAHDRRYNGSGTITISGYKTYARKLPVLTIASLTPNAGVLTRVAAMKLEFNGADFIVPTAPGSAPFRVVNSVIRSTPTATGVIVRSATGAGEISFMGCSVQVQHTVGTANGVFEYPAGNTGSEIALCAISLDNQNTVSTGNVKVRGCYTSTGTGSPAVFVGASVDAFSVSGNNPFKDPLNSDPDLADFTLTPGTQAIGVVPSATQVQGTAATETITDCRLLTRSAFPNGDTSLDAGAYESNFFVPDPHNTYMDMAKTRSGSGQPGDRWSPSDLQAWCDANSGTVLRKKLRVNTVRSGRLDLVVSNLEADVNGGLEIVSEQVENPILWESAETGNIAVRSCTGLSLALHRVMLRNTTGAPAITVSDSQLCDTEIVSSIIDVKRSGTAWRIVVSNAWSGTGTIVVTQDGLDTTVALDTPAGLAGVPGIVGTMSAAGFVAVQHVDALVVVLHGQSAVSSLPGLVSTRLTADVEVNGNLLVLGSSFNSEFSEELGLVTDVLRGDNVSAYYSSAQGHAFSATTKTGDFVDAPASDVRWCGGNQVTVGTQDGCVQAPGQLFTSLRAPDTDASAFSLLGNTLVGIVSENTVSAAVSTPGFDTDIHGKLRSQAFAGGSPLYDAGAVETYSLSPTQSFSGTPDTITTHVTEVGYSMNARALAGDVQYKLVGFSYSNSGYCYWAPERVVASVEASKQARSSVTVSSNTGFQSDRVTVVADGSTFIVTYGSEFSAGTTSADTASNVAKALRAQPGFAQVCWCTTSGSTVLIYNQRYGNHTAPVVTVLGPNVVVGASVAGVDSTGVPNQVYPISGYAPWATVEVPDPRSRSFVARLGESDGVFIYGEVMVIGQVTGSVFADEVGDTFVYAVSTSPISSKHDRKIAIKRFIFSY